MNAGARPDVHDAIGGGDDVRVVLHHENGVALVTQRAQELGKPADVVGMQPRARLVEDVGHPGQAAAQVSDELEALPLTARECRRRAVEAQVAQPDRDDSLERGGGGLDHRGGRRVLDRGDHPDELGDLHARPVGDRAALDLRSPRRRVQPRSLARRADPVGDHGAIEARVFSLSGVAAASRLSHLRVSLGTRPA